MRLTVDEVAGWIARDLKGYPRGYRGSMDLDNYVWPPAVAIQQKLLNSYRLRVRVQYTRTEIVYVLL